MTPTPKSLLLTVLVVSTLVKVSKGKCSPGVPRLGNCDTVSLNLLETYELFHRSCDGKTCSENPFYACVGTSLSATGTIKDSCGDGICQRRRKAGETCQMKGESCCDVFGQSYSTKVNVPDARFKTFCDQQTKTCNICSVTGFVCGDQKPFIPCCDKNVTCQKYNNMEFRCVKDICDRTLETGFNCPSVENGFKFCKCGSSPSKGYAQCDMHKYYKCEKCVTVGGKCKTPKDCCWRSTNRFDKYSDSIKGCLNGTCTYCLEETTVGCKAKKFIPCCGIDGYYDPAVVCSEDDVCE